MHLNFGDVTGVSGDKLQFFIDQDGTDLVDAEDINIVHTDGPGSMYGWRHIVVVVHNFSTADTFAELFLDGVSVGSDTVGGEIPTADWDTSLRLGRPGTSERYLFGMMDEVIIFNRSLTQQEIDALYSSSADEYQNNFTNLVEGTHTFTGWTRPR